MVFVAMLSCLHSLPLLAEMEIGDCIKIKGLLRGAELLSVRYGSFTTGESFEVWQERLTNLYYNNNSINIMIIKLEELSNQNFG